MLKDEYKKYIDNFENCRASMVSDSGTDISNALVVMSGTRLRIGQILADMTLEYLQHFSDLKAKGQTDKESDANARLRQNDINGISMAHFERFYKDLDSLEKSLKKRLRVLEMETFTNQ
jgi:hypothetical protein